MLVSELAKPKVMHHRSGRLLAVAAIVSTAGMLTLGCSNNADKSAGVDLSKTDTHEDGYTKSEKSQSSEPTSLVEDTAHKSRIRFEPLSAEQFPQVVPENGARHGYATILESLGSGAASIDVDLDGWPDAVIAGGGDFDGKTLLGLPLHYLRNLRTQFADQSDVANFGPTRFYHHGLSAVDFDHDGFQDLLVTGYGGIQLFCNQGDGTFLEAPTGAGLDCPTWNASAAWGDFNHDGHPDLYVTAYVDWSFDNDPPCFAADGVTRDNCSPKLFEPEPDSLFISGGDGTFSNRSQQFGIRSDGKALGVVAADLNSDGLLDLYVGNDVMMNFLYQNVDGKKFKDWSIYSGAAVSNRGSPDASMGVSVVDYNLDGRFDIWAANFEMESFALYANQGQMQFRHVSDMTGVSAIGAHYVGWGTTFSDLDLDGDGDTVICNGNVVQHPQHSPTLQKMVALENIDGQYFLEVTPQAGEALMTPVNGRGLAATDWNQDGLIDLIVTPTLVRSQLLENRSDAAGNSLTLQLVGRQSPRHATGTVVSLETTSNATNASVIQSKQLKGGGSYCSSSHPVVHFGYSEKSTVKSLQIRWPGGKIQTVTVEPGSQFLAVIEPEASSEQRSGRHYNMVK